MQPYMIRFRRRLAVIARMFSRPRYVLIAAASAAVFAGLPILVPLLTIPSDTLPLELSIMSPVDYVFLILLALASGTLISANLFLLSERRLRLGTAGATGIGSLIALVGGVVATSCGCGVGIIFGLIGLGIGSATFVIDHQLPLMAIALAIVLVSLHMALNKADSACELPKG